MSSHLNPYIGFAGSARDAMEFYKDVFGGDLNMNTYGDFGQAGTPNENLIMHAQLETPAGFTLMAADSTEGTDTPDSDISISLSGDDEADLGPGLARGQQLAADHGVHRHDAALE